MNCNNLIKAHQTVVKVIQSVQT